MATFQNILHTEQLFGCWEKQDTFQLGIGINTMVNSVERYTFNQDGTGTHSYIDDSELPKQDTYCEFSFNVDDDRIVFLSAGSSDDSAAIDFRMDGNKLILDYDGFEEVYIKSVSDTIDQ